MLAPRSRPTLCRKQGGSAIREIRRTVWHVARIDLTVICGYGRASRGPVSSYKLTGSTRVSSR